MAVAELGGLLLLALLLQRPAPAAGAPIVDLSGRRWRVGRQIARLREPMPWEDGYFDPSYHVWPKGRQQAAAEKQSVKFHSGGAGGGDGGDGGEPTARTKAQNQQLPPDAKDNKF